MMYKILLNDRDEIVRALSVEIDDDVGQYKAHIYQAIARAIDFYRYENFYFNETTDYSFNLLINIEEYQPKIWPHLEQVDRIKKAMLLTSTQTRLLHPVSYDAFLLLKKQYMQLGEPVYFCFSNHVLHVCPIPDRDYPLRLHVLPYLFLELDGDNPWLTKAFGLIKARAKYELFRDILKFPEAAQAAFLEMNEHYERLLIATSYYKNTNQIIATEF